MPYVAAVLLAPLYDGAPFCRLHTDHLPGAWSGKGGKTTRTTTTTTTTSVAIAAQIDMAAPRGRGRGRTTSASMGRCELRRLTGTTTAATTTTTTPLAIARITAGRRGSPSAVFRIHEHVLVAERAILARDLFFGERFFFFKKNIFEYFLKTF